jgi:hypothetical protein
MRDLLDNFVGINAGSFFEKFHEILKAQHPPRISQIYAILEKFQEKYIKIFLQKKKSIS